MVLVTTECIGGRELQALGLVQGSTVRSKNFGKDLKAVAQTLRGGEIKPYTGLMREAREEASQRMIEQALAMGADAIVAVRYATAQLMDTAAEVMAYGTAVKYK